MDALATSATGICPHWTTDNYTDQLQGRMIYKDECCKCFNTPKSAKGLDLCMKCLYGSCQETHSKSHFDQKKHPLVLNITQIPIKKEGLTKVTKLAIGKPGGIDADTDNFET